MKFIPIYSKILYERGILLYKNEKYHLSKLFLPFRKIRQVSHKKYDKMSLVKQKINPSIDKRDSRKIRRDKMDFFIAYKKIITNAHNNFIMG